MASQSLTFGYDQRGLLTTAADQRGGGRGAPAAHMSSKPALKMYAAIAWLEQVGFRLMASRGGRLEAFGSAVLVFSGDIEVVITRDRGQWDIAVALVPGGRPFGHAVAAAGGREWMPPTFDGQADVPRQLPPGLGWREHLPLALDWLRKPGSVEALIHLPSDQIPRPAAWLRLCVRLRRGELCRGNAHCVEDGVHFRNGQFAVVVERAHPR